jgi:hypothetical protein
MNVYQRLNNAREQFHSLKLTKTGHNKFAGYYYFELGDFLIPALKVFKDNGLCACVSFGADEAYMTITNVDKPEEGIRLTSPMGSAALKGCHEVQNIGAVETYQRRYLWVAALEIVEHDALDATTGKDKPKVVHKPTDQPLDLTDDRKAELDELALVLIEAHAEGRSLHASQMFYALPEQDEKLYVWQQLATESKVRSAIQANKPQKETA